MSTVALRAHKQALLQVLQSEWDKTFSRFSFGYRPRRSAHQAVACAQQFLRESYAGVVDWDLERFFDRVVHDVLLARAKKRVRDRRVLKLIDRYLKSGAMVGVTLEPTEKGVLHGCPLSPLLANLPLDDLDRSSIVVATALCATPTTSRSSWGASVRASGCWPV